MIRTALLSLLAFGSLALHAAPPTLRHVTLCSNGSAAGYACSQVDLAAHVDLAALGAGIGQEGNDLWGWTDATTGREYALVGTTDGTAFVDITVADHPSVLGFLPTHSSTSLWRDIKVHDDHAFIVSEAVNHGMQVFDLTRLRNVVSPPQVFTADAHYARFGRAHNIVINEDTGFAYAVGSRQGTTTCDAGLHMIDVSDPRAPQFAGCFPDDGYTHDAQCVVYAGPDPDYTGRELCFASNEDTLTIVDVTQKSAPVQIARVGYAGSAYSHQGWLTPDQRWLLMDDELDELNFGHNTRTYVWDLADLDAPQQTFAYTGPVPATDHNLYIRDQYAFLANYKSGLRILDLSGIAQGQISEIGFFDTYPPNDATGFDGAWSSYPFFASGHVIVNDISRGLFVLRPRLCQEPAAIGGLSARPDGDHRIALSWNASLVPGATYEVHRALGGCGAGVGEPIASGLATPALLDDNVSGQVSYGYRVRVAAGSAECRSEFSECVEASTSGSCSAPPQFSGLSSATAPPSARCAIELGWSAATPTCAGPVRYDIHRGTDATFVPTPDNRIGSTRADTGWVDFGIADGGPYHYLVRARDLGNGSSDANLVRHAASPVGAPQSGVWRNGAEPQEPLLASGSGLLRHVAWHADETLPHSGTRVYASGYADADCIALTTEPITLEPSPGARLTFFQRYGMEAGKDGGRVELSTDGVSWTPIAPVGGYPQQIASAGNACGWPVGTPVYGGTALGWHQQQFDLSAISGAIRLRWVFSTDAAIAAQGWFVDSIAVSPAQVSGTCTPQPNTSVLALTPAVPSPAVIGQSLTLPFSLQATPSGTPTGSVTLGLDSGESCVALLPESACDLLPLQAGLRTLTARYSGDGDFPATETTAPLQIDRAALGLQLEVTSIVPTPAGPVNLRIDVTETAALGPASGEVRIDSDLDSATCTLTLPQTDCSLTLTSTGTHQLSARYAGDARYAPITVSLPHLVYADVALFGDGFE